MPRATRLMGILAAIIALAAGLAAVPVYAYADRDDTLAVAQVALGERPREAPGGVRMDDVATADLPREARDTLALIKRGGPFPYRKDGDRFNNRERLLPSKPRAYYREYTVPTPGARDRGARRIVAGQGGEYYYTDDHYSSFRRIRE
jgi:ribonuclease T1